MFLSNLLDSPNPTIFELSMADNLAAGLKPAFEYLLRTLGERYPALFDLFAWKDELFLATLAVIQRHYLAVYDGSFAENFYALKRSKHGPEPRPLAARDKFVSLLAVAVVPYLQSKLAGAHERLAVALRQSEEDAARAQAREPREEQSSVDDGEADRRKPSKLEREVRRLALHAVPATFAAYEAWALLFKILFMFGKTPYYCPSLWMQGVIITRVTGDDMRKQMMREDVLAASRGFVGRAISKAIGLLRTALIASALVFKLVEWYYSPENQSQREALQGPALLPPPPVPPKPRSTEFRMPHDPRLCPICHEPRVNPAVSTSGLAFCYTCIHRFSLEHGQCPVTGTPCVPTQIRRIFMS